MAGADPTELVALSDALDDPGDLPYSPAARQRFGLLASELRYLRSHAGEPLLELVRRIIDACGLDVELASSVSEAGRARRENLDLFVKAVADFQAVDGDGQPDVPAGLAPGRGRPRRGSRRRDPQRGRLGEAADRPPRQGAGVGRRVPGRHVRREVPAHPQPRPVARAARPAAHAAARRPSRPAGAPRPHQGRAGPAARRTPRQHEATEELRLGYVAFTRARHRLVVSSYVWAEGRAGAAGALAVPGDRARRDAPAGAARRCAWEDKPEKGVANPLFGRLVEYPWPVAERTAEALRRVAAAELVGEALDRLAAAPEAAAADAGLDLVEQARVREWDDELAHLVAEARRDRAQVVEVPLPAALSATTLQRLRQDPDGLRRRPGPADAATARRRPPASAPCSTSGSSSGSGSRRCSSPRRSPTAATTTSTTTPTCAS